MLHSIADELRTIAAFGLNFAKDPHTVEWYEAVSAASVRLTAVDFFDENNLPPLSPGHHLRIPHIFKQLRDDAPIPFFDKV